MAGTRIKPITGGLELRAPFLPYVRICGFINTTHKSCFCGGTLISQRIVLTAKHCSHVQHAESRFARSLFILYKYHDSVDSLKYIETVCDVRRYPEDPGNNKIFHELAILVLSNKVDIPVKDLAEFPSEPPLRGHIVSVYGHGHEKSNPRVIPRFVKVGTVEVVGYDLCTMLLKNSEIGFNKWRKSINISTVEFFRLNWFCVRSRTDSTLEGDSGGPVVFKDTNWIVGIVSHGPIHDRPEPDQWYFRVFINLHYPKYKEWIIKNRDEIAAQYGDTLDDSDAI